MTHYLTFDTEQGPVDEADTRREEFLLREWQKGQTPCPGNSRFGYIHNPRVVGTPLSGCTYYECESCGLRWFRG